MKKTAAGFTLFEVLIAMFITGTALLGLAVMNVYILKSSQSSFNYTVATIRANNFIDAVWLDLCNAQSAATGTYANIRRDWAAQVSAAGMTVDTNNPPMAYAADTQVTLSWQDKRFSNDDANNVVSMAVRFPSSGCE